MVHPLTLAGSPAARLRALCCGHSAGVASRMANMLLVVAAFGAALGVGAHLSMRGREIDALDAQVQAAGRQLEATSRAAPAATASAPMSEWQWRRYGEAIAQLNAPWPAIFDVMERVGVEQAVPIGVEPDIQAGRARLVIEARTLSQAYAYLGQLSRDPGVERVQLIRHEVVSPVAPGAQGGARSASVAGPAGTGLVRMTADVFWRVGARAPKDPA